MKKDLSWLNSKWWYRLIKVVFIFIFIGVLALANILVVNDNNDGHLRSINKSKSYLVCNFGSRNGEKISTSEIDGTIPVSYFNKKSFDYKSFLLGYNDFLFKKILSVCSGDDDFEKADVLMIQRVAEISFPARKQGKTEEEISILMENDSALNSIENNYYSNYERSQVLTFNEQLFDLNGSYTYKDSMKSILVTTAIVFVAFELLRRIFYYIVLGSFLPEKPEKYLFIKTKFYKEKEQE